MIPPTTHDPPCGRRAPADPDHGAAAPPPPGGAAGAAAASGEYDRLSHELRTPLNAILGYAELMLDGSAGPLTDQARECAANIQAAGRHLLRRVEAWHGRAEGGGARDAAESGPASAAAVGSVELIGLLRVRLAVPVEPRTAVLRCIGEAERLERLADALVDLLAGAGEREAGDTAGAVAVAVAVEDRDEGAAVALTLRRPAGAPPAATVRLVEALAAGQGAAVERGEGGVLVLVWPSRLVLERRA